MGLSIRLACMGLGGGVSGICWQDLTGTFIFPFPSPAKQTLQSNTSLPSLRTHRTMHIEMVATLVVHLYLMFSSVCMCKETMEYLLLGLGMMWRGTVIIMEIGRAHV